MSARRAGVGAALAAVDVKTAAKAAPTCETEDLHPNPLPEYREREPEGAPPKHEPHPGVPLPSTQKGRPGYKADAAL